MTRGMTKILKQVRQLQADMLRRQKELASLKVEGSAGGDMVRVEMDGEREVLSVRIDPALLKQGDLEVLQDLLAAAFNDAVDKLEPELHKRFGDMVDVLDIMEML